MPNEIIARRPSADNTLYTLQAGRGIAALAVVLHHADNAVSKQNAPLPEWLSTIFAYGYLGVDFFFVLSGFIIYYVNHSRTQQPGFASKYLKSRFVRVFIPYWPIGIAVAIAYMLLPGLASGANDWGWFSTLTLLPASEGPALAPAWTLQHEILFYAFALICLLLNRLLLLSIVAAIAVAAYSFALPGGYKALGLVDLEFLFGIVVAWCFINEKMMQNVVLALVGLALCVLFFIVDIRLYSVIFGLGLAFLLLPIVRAEAAGRFTIGPVLTLLGGASYAIYLIHYPLMSGLARLTSEWNMMAAFALLVTIATAAGIAYHKLFELPAIKLSRHWLDKVLPDKSAKPADS